MAFKDQGLLASRAADVMPLAVFERLKRRAVWSARVSVEMLCSPVPLPGLPGTVAWDALRLDAAQVDAETLLYDLNDLQDAVQCLDELGLLWRPLPDRPNVISFLPEIEDYEPQLATRAHLGRALQ